MIIKLEKYSAVCFEISDANKNCGAKYENGELVFITFEAVRFHVEIYNDFPAYERGMALLLRVLLRYNLVLTVKYSCHSTSRNGRNIK